MYLGLGLALYQPNVGSAGGGPGFGVDNLLMETGDNLLLETGDVLLLE